MYQDNGYIIELPISYSEKYGAEIIQWCEENIQRKWRFRNQMSSRYQNWVPYEITIYEKSDAMHFKLVWL